MREACIDQFDSMNCRAAVNFCDSELSTAMWATGKDGVWLILGRIAILIWQYQSREERV